MIYVRDLDEEVTYEFKDLHDPSIPKVLEELSNDHKWFVAQDEDEEPLKVVYVNKQLWLDYPEEDEVI